MPRKSLAAQIKARPSQSGKRSNNFSWKQRWKPVKDQVTRIVLIKGDYVGHDGQPCDYKEYVDFYSAASNRSFISSGIWKRDVDTGRLEMVSGACLGYNKMRREMDENIERDRRTIRMGIRSGFNVIVLNDFHEVQALDKDKKPRVYASGDNKGEPMYDEVECEGRRCPSCQNGDPKAFGANRHWTLGPSHIRQLGSIAETISESCTCGGKLDVVDHFCGECNEVIIDMNTSKLTDDEITSITASPYKCECSHSDYLEETLECSKCAKPRRTSIYEVILSIKRVGENTESIIQMTDWEPMEDETDLRAIEELEETVLDLNEVFAGSTAEEQAAVLRMKPTGHSNQDGNEDKNTGRRARRERTAKNYGA